MYKSNRGGRKRQKYTMKRRPKTGHRLGQGIGIYSNALPRGAKPELKYIDYFATQADTGTAVVAAQGTAGPDQAPAETWHLLNGVTLGTDTTKRVGRQLVMRSLLVRLCIQPLTYDVAHSGCIRMMVVYDAMANGAQGPSAAKLLTSTQSTQSLANTLIVSPTFLDNRERFRILYDKTYCMDSGGRMTVAVKKFKRLNLPVQFNAGDDGVITDINVGSLYLGFIAAVDTAPRASLWTRVRFIDA